MYDRHVLLMDSCDEIIPKCLTFVEVSCSENSCEHLSGNSSAVQDLARDHQDVTILANFSLLASRCTRAS